MFYIQYKSIFILLMLMQRFPLSHYVFPNPDEVDPNGDGLICIGGDLEPATLFEAYCHGLFPWFNEGDPICWWCPNPRCIIYPDQFRPSKSLLRMMKKHDYKITINRAFSQVIRNCSLPRNYTNETWISQQIIESYEKLFSAGYGYSIEVWDKEVLVGGLYGVNIAQGCFGESMFSTQTDTSKMAFYVLMLIGKAQNLEWIDCQLENDHLMRLGATTISRKKYLQSLRTVLNKPKMDWKMYQDSVFSSKTIAENAELILG